MGAENEPVAVIRTAVGHIVAFRAADLVPGEVGGGEKFDFGDDDGFVVGGDGVWGLVWDLVRGDEEGVGLWIEDARFVEVRCSWVGD